MTEPTLASSLEALLARTPIAERVHDDPIRWPRAYERADDREAAALVAALFAFGRVASIHRWLAGLFARADAAGGPAAWARHFDLVRDGPALADCRYRWVSGADTALFVAAIGRVLRDHGGLEPLFAGGGGVRARIERASDSLRVAADEAAASAEWAPAGRGLRHVLASPRAGSACKRWHLFLRWMVRSSDDGVDLGAWTALTPAELLIPVDTHVHRVARFLGLTRRPRADWRAAEEITAALAAIDPEDPVRFDFALAHLGIARNCLGHRAPDVCPSCPLDPICACQ